MFIVIALSIGAAAGGIAGAAAAALFKNGWSRVGWDAMLGAVGFLATLLAFAAEPWPHAEPVALTIAVVLSVVHEAWRSRAAPGPEPSALSP